MREYQCQGLRKEHPDGIDSFGENIVSVPESVRKAAEQANQFIESQGNTAPAAPPEGEPKPAGTPEPQAKEPEAKTPEAKTEPTEKKTDDFQPLDKPLGDDDAKWQDRYKILQGKYNAETKRLLDENKSMKERLANAAPVDQSEVNNLKTEVDRLKQQLAAASPTKPDGNMTEREKQLREELGDEVFDFFEDKWGRQVGQIAERVNEANSKIEKSAHESTTETRKALMRNRLASRGVDFDSRNTDPLFIEFINSRAEDGVALSSVLSSAFSQGDLNKVEEIFLAYDAPTAPTAPESSAPDLSQHVRVKPSAAPTDAVPQVEPWNDDQIKALYQDRDRGRITPEEFARYEKALFAWLATQK